MKQFKFRGRHIDTGEFVYAELGQISAVSDDPNLLLFLTEKPCLVHTNSIAQLVGHDAAGNEVYEGDVLLDELDCEWEARLTPTDLRGLTLKE